MDLGVRRILGWSQASEKKPDANEIQECLFGAGEPFIIFAETSLPSNPRKRPLDDPAPGEAETSAARACARARRES
jgi:hypothetical protein